MKNVIIIGNGEKEKIQEKARELKECIGEICNITEVDLENTLSLEDAEADLVITLGGDGAVLRTTHRMGSNQMPLLGVNLGKLGFLSTIESDEIDSVLPNLLSSDLRITERSRLICRLSQEDEDDVLYSSLNDAVITRGGISRMVSMDVRVNQHELANFSGDGLIISTPTGSTAHNLSAGGPVMDPELKAFVITPLAPHTLSLRPYVVSGQKTIQVQINKSPEKAVLTADGQLFHEVQSGDQLTIQTADNPAQLVTLPDRSFYATLNKKLNWGSSPGDINGGTTS